MVSGSSIMGNHKLNYTPSHSHLMAVLLLPVLFSERDNEYSHTVFFLKIISSVFIYFALPLILVAFSVIYYSNDIFCSIIL